jgi:dihydrofolate reductase
MRSLVAGLLISLDGVVESPGAWGWSEYMNEEMTAGIAAGVAQADAVLLGRRTYLEFARIWPGQPSEVAMADFLNNSPKYVVSSQLRPPLEWAHSTLITGDLREELIKLKEQPGKDILVPGSPTLVRSLLRDGLLDRLSLNICPVVVGNGMRLFDGPLELIRLKLADSRTLSTGVLGVTYEYAARKTRTASSATRSSRSPASGSAST